MQIFPIETAKNIVAIMTGEDTGEQVKTPIVETSAPEKSAPILNKEVETQPVNIAPKEQQYNMSNVQYQQPQYQQPQPQYQQPVEVHQASFEPLIPQNSVPPIKNIDLIMDVPLDISVVLGRTKKSIQDILNLGTGSLIELQKLAEEPVEILVNGKQIALGEVVVVDENFGVRITNIVSNVERIKTLK